MKRGGQNRIVLVTCAKRAEARQIARAVVGGRLGERRRLHRAPEKVSIEVLRLRFGLGP